MDICNSKGKRSLYIVYSWFGPLQAAITAATLRGIVSTSRCTTASSIVFHWAWKRQLCCVTNVGRSQRCLIGFRSVFCAGQSNRWTPLSVYQAIVASQHCRWHCHAESNMGPPVKLPQSRKRKVILNFAVGLIVESSRNYDKGFRAIPGEKPPQHKSTSTELHG